MQVRAPSYPTRLVVLGHPVAQSLSPQFQNAALEHAGLTQRYGAIDVLPSGLTETLAQLAREGAGGNVTMPHKQAAFALAARTSPLAARLGAVNTFWHEDGVLVGHNTDVAGVLASILALCPNGVRGARCTVLGGGGAAAAVYVSLADLGCTDVQVWTRSPTRTSLLANRARVHIRVAATLDDALDGATLVVNATPIGKDGVAMPLSPDDLPDNIAVCDLVYHRDTTAFVRQCRTRGLRAEDGRRMLVEQGAESFRTWFDVEPSLDVMWQALGETSADA